MSPSTAYSPMTMTMTMTMSSNARKSKGLGGTSTRTARLAKPEVFEDLARKYRQRMAAAGMSISGYLEEETTPADSQTRTLFVDAVGAGESVCGDGGSSVTIITTTADGYRSFTHAGGNGNGNGGGDYRTTRRFTDMMAMATTTTPTLSVDSVTSPTTTTSPSLHPYNPRNRITSTSTSSPPPTPSFTLGPSLLFGLASGRLDRCLRPNTATKPISSGELKLLLTFNHANPRVLCNVDGTVGAAKVPAAEQSPSTGFVRRVETGVVEPRVTKVGGKRVGVRRVNNKAPSSSSAKGRGIAAATSTTTSTTTTAATPSFLPRVIAKEIRTAGGVHVVNPASWPKARVLSSSSNVTGNLSSRR